MPGAENPVASPAAAPDAPAQPQPPASTHLYDAVSTQRDRVLGAFDTQRAAILKAVADQRESALKPVRSVQARQAGTAPGVAGPSTQRQLVAADIVLALKAMVAEEVRAQLAALVGVAPADRHRD